MTILYILAIAFLVGCWVYGKSLPETTKPQPKK